MRRPNSVLFALPVALALSTPAEAHDARFSDEPTRYFLQTGLAVDQGTLITKARGEVSKHITSMGPEICLTTHGRKEVDYKPCARMDLVVNEFKTKSSFVFDFARAEYDFHHTDGLYIEWGIGIRIQKHRQARMVGYNAELALGWRTDSQKPGVGGFVTAGPFSTGLVSTKRIPQRFLDADGTASVGLNGFRANGDLGAFFPAREAGIWDGLVVKVGYLFPVKKNSYQSQLPDDFPVLQMNDD